MCLNFLSALPFLLTILLKIYILRSLGAWEMTQEVKTLAVQLWGPEFKSPGSHAFLACIMRIEERGETQLVLWSLGNSQPNPDGWLLASMRDIFSNVRSSRKWHLHFLLPFGCLCMDIHIQNHVNAKCTHLQHNII